jgi:hypothetical protein
MEMIQKILDDMRPVDWVILSIAVTPYILLGRAIVKEKGAKQNLITWILWFFLDVIQLTTTYDAKGTYLFLIIITIGGGVTTFLLLKNGKRKWDKKFHTRVIIAVGVCITVWCTFGSYYAIFFSTAAQVIAGLPQLKDMWEEPDPKLLPSYVSFFIMNTLAFIFAKAWTFEDRFFTGVFIIFGILTLYPLLRELRRRYNFKKFYGRN